ncbi:11195_t:CDS:2 [Ambispora leptoticha]|uniref:11195_t:CDS:1 n=1 Tax=Ambispora leptoticha TaxID=144679 RepID=A0A9N8WDZ7_9GLOM|nr:11195_t:CDS:2 [Ambispora leptoticha]
MTNKTQQRGVVSVDGKNIITSLTPQFSYIVTLPNESAGLTTHPETHQQFTTFNNTNIATDSNHNNTDQSRNFSLVLSEIISNLDKATRDKIRQQTKLTIEDLIKPKGKFRNGVPPRPQNPWVIYRKDLQAKLVAEQGAEIEFGARVGSISKMASEKWNVEPQEVKQVYEIIAEVAKRVHEQMFPNYKYKPRRKGNNTGFSRRSSSASDNSMEGFKKNLGDFTTNTSSFPIERLGRRKSSASDNADDIKNSLFLNNNSSNINNNNYSLSTALSPIMSGIKKPYPSPPLTTSGRPMSPHNLYPPSLSSSSSSNSLANNPHWTISNQIPSPSITATSNTDSIQQNTDSIQQPPPHSAGGIQVQIIPSWTFDTGRSSSLNIFNDENSSNHNNHHHHQVLNHNPLSLPLTSASSLSHQSNNINSFNNINDHHHNNNNNDNNAESTTGSFLPFDFDIQGPFRHITNHLLEMSPSIAYTIEYDQRLTRLFGTP